ncbi:hypothetical protein A0J61_02534 [Choanephora cucurbitarum]|uniref:ATP-dependent DNA helicase n=1 Tax=Choanephora cucurbitarum TaxID=101091 RepID=A0A1C7NJT0_9FUNG|nr:hypothetical protein A0J61_02534 [Choanephora cucurbitarum]
MKSVYLTNQNVVPYNPFLTKKYKAHINIELCGSADAIKCINKCVYKGPDRTTIHLRNENDEIERYLTSRYIGPTEAVWRLFEYVMHEEDPSVTSLSVHLENGQPIYFDPEASAEEIQLILDNMHSALMGFFKYNAANENGRRMYYCTPTAGERFFLRLFLTVVRGPTSFQDLRTVKGVVYATFREACQALHLIEDDQDLCSLLISALLFQELNQPAALWNEFCLSICDDLDVRMRQLGFADQLNSHETEHAFHKDLPKLDYGLYLLEQALIDAGKTLADFNMPQPLFDWRHLMEQIGEISSNAVFQTGVAYDRNIEEAKYQQKVSMMNTGQKVAFDEIIDNIFSNPKTAHFFLQGPAGTGKTLVYNTLCHYFRRQRRVVVRIASSGIASLLLPGGRTSHSRFKIPLNIFPDSVCLIKKDSDLASIVV